MLDHVATGEVALAEADSVPDPPSCAIGLHDLDERRGPRHQGEVEGECRRPEGKDAAGVGQQGGPCSAEVVGALGDVPIVRWIRGRRVVHACGDPSPTAAAYPLPDLVPCEAVRQRCLPRDEEGR
jgi:hypothetical protein